MSQKNNGIVIYCNGESRTENQDNFPIGDDITTDKKTNKLGNITIVITIAIVVGLVLFASIYFTRKNKKTPSPEIICENCDNTTIVEPNIFEPEMKKLEYEYKFKTNVHDLRRFNVHQKYYEDYIINNNLTRIFLNRITNYDVYFMSEEESKGDEKKYYEKIYTAAISIVSECFSRENETCVPKKLVDLTSPDYNENKDKKEINDLKDIPIPICLFNITDNDAITSITCHKLIPEHKKRMIVLDLYFFRPPVVKKINKEESNITINYIDDNKQIIREKNGGICDIENAFTSFCSNDMNTTIDSEFNLLEYEEIAIMEVENDDKNSYKKTKITKLVDETNNVTSFNYEKYEENLNKLLPKLEPYFQTDILFSKEDYEEVYIASIEGVGQLRDHLQYNKLKKRKLTKYNSSKKRFF